MQHETADKESLNNPHLRRIGSGFIICREAPLMGHQMTNGYLDQHDRMFVLVNNTFEPLGDCRRFLVVAEEYFEYSESLSESFTNQVNGSGTWP